MKNLVPLLVVLALIVLHAHRQQQQPQPTIEIPANQHCVIKLHAITIERSKIHVVTECWAEVHDVYGNVITELPANFNGTIHLHLNCSKPSTLSIWLDHGAVFYE